MLGHGRVFNQIGLGSVELLIQEIEKDKKKYEDDRAKRLSAKAEEATKAATPGGQTENEKPSNGSDKPEAEPEKGQVEKIETEKVGAERAATTKVETMEVDA